MNLHKYFTQPRHVTIGEFWVISVCVFILAGTIAQGTIEYSRVTAQRQVRIIARDTENMLLTESDKIRERLDRMEKDIYKNTRRVEVLELNRMGEYETNLQMQTQRGLNENRNKTMG